MASIYENITDEELIMLLRDGDLRITDYLMEKYKSLVLKEAKTMFIIGADKDDLIQEGMIGLYKAIRDYDSGRDASFYTFADLCISRQMYKAVEAGNRKKNMPLNTYVSIYDSANADGDSVEGVNLIELISDVSDNNPEELIIDRENVLSLEKSIQDALSDFEKQVLNLRLTGMGYVEIARILGKDEKSVDNALSRIKSKVKNLVAQRF